MVELGLGGSTYYLHQSLLPRLLKLAEEMQKVQEKEKAKTQAKEDAKAKGKGQGKGQGRGAGKAPAMITITIMAHDRDAFGQMIDYLYRDQFVWKKKVPTERLDEMRELMSLAKYYALPGLQKQIVKLFSSSKLIHRVSPGRFFDWAEDMYSEEIHHENGPFTVYFSKTAPGLMKQVDEATKADMSRMIKSGGGFADQLYRALFVVSDPFRSLDRKLIDLGIRDADGVRGRQERRFCSCPSSHFLIQGEGARSVAPVTWTLDPGLPVT